MYTITPKEAFTEVTKVISVGLTPLLTSSPGVGKSAIVAQIAKQYNLKMIDLRLSQCMPEDLNGLPMRQGNKATFTPYDMFPLENEDIPEGFDGWMLFLDELTSATKPVQAAAYKLILDRMVGSFKLHPNVAIVAAGNKITDKAVVHQMSTALQSRVVHYEMETNAKDFLNYAMTSDIDYRITGFISFQPHKVMDFRPDHQDKTFACPRTWEFLSRLIKGEDVSPAIAPRIAGTVGQGAAVEFIAFAQEYDRIPKFRDIMNDPKGAMVPAEASTKYATISMLIENTNATNMADVITYLSRFPIEIQVIFCRGIGARHPTLRSGLGSNSAFDQYMLKMVRYLN